MSEPTPLSAEAARAMTLLVMASRVDPNLRSAVADVETYIAELQREIAALKGALEKAHRDRIAQSNGYSCGCWWDNRDDEAPAGVTLVVSPDCWLQRVLAGKEAQGD